MNKLVIFENNPSNINKNNYNFVWSKFDNKTINFLSLLKIKNFDEKKIKKEITHNLKSFFFSKINNQEIFKIFKLDNKFSLCNLSNFVEKNPYKKNFNLDLIKIEILKQFIKEKKIDDVKIVSKNNDFKNKIKICLGLNKNRNNKAGDFKLIKIDYFFMFVKNFLVLVNFILKNINFFSKPKKIENNKPIFVSFFSYTNKKNALNGNYVSEYWKGFRYTKNKNWLHLYDSSPEYKSSNEVRNCIKKINNKSKVINHFFLEDYLTISVVIKSLFKILSIYVFIIKSNFQLKNKSSYYNQYYKFFFEEIISFTFFRNILLFYQFKKFFKKNQINSNIFFCMENQPWEKILLYFLVKNKYRSKSYGVIHSSIRFWDLRFMNFKDNKRNINGYHNPNAILSNSKFGSKILKENGYKKKIIINVETLRYLNLKDKKKLRLNKIKNTKKNVLFLSDYDDDCNNFFKQIIHSYKDHKDKFIYLKCHKLKPIKIFQKNLKIINNLNEIRKKIDYVVVSNMTAAALDLYYEGIKPFVYLKYNDLDYSPLYRFTNYSTFSSIESLNQLIKKKKYTSKKKIMNKIRFKNYFIIDKKLSIWKKLLNYDFKK